MAQKDDPSREWGPEPGAASGGHLAAEPAQGESWFDILNAPLPSELEQDSEPDRKQRTPSRDERRPARRRPRDEMQETRRSTPVPRTRRSPTRRRVRRTIRRVDPLSVLKISVVMYTLMLGLWLLVVAFIYNFLSGLGLFDTINSAAEGFALEEVDVTLGVVEKWAFIVGLAFVVAGSVINVIVALLYNLISNLIGGIEITFSERDL